MIVFKHAGAFVFFTVFYDFNLRRQSSGHHQGEVGRDSGCDVLVLCVLQKLSSAAPSCYAMCSASWPKWENPVSKRVCPFCVVLFEMNNDQKEPAAAGFQQVIILHRSTHRIHRACFLCLFCVFLLLLLCRCSSVLLILRCKSCNFLLRLIRGSRSKVARK